MIRWLLLATLALTGCAVPATRLQLTESCNESMSSAQVTADHWLAVPDVWRLRQSTLIEIRGRKIPLEGFMLLDLAQQQIRLVAMNEMGIVLFELLVTATSEELLRAVPQLQQQRGLAQGIADSLRRIYLLPRPHSTDYYQQRDTSLRLWRSTADEQIDFIYDCPGRLRMAAMSSDVSSWQVLYQDYRQVEGRQLPEQIVMNDYQHGVSLTIRQQEATRVQ